MCDCADRWGRIMSEEKKLTFQLVGSVVITVLFFYFTWSASRWTEHVEQSLTSLHAVNSERGPKVAAIEMEVRNLRDTDQELKASFERLNDKLDRILELIQVKHALPERNARQRD